MQLHVGLHVFALTWYFNISFLKLFLPRVIYSQQVHTRKSIRSLYKVTASVFYVHLCLYLTLGGICVCKNVSCLGLLFKKKLLVPWKAHVHVSVMKTC